MDEALRACLLSILQRGLTEARAYALAGESDKATALLDALDNIPRHLHDWSETSEDEIHDQLATFQRAHPDHPTDFARILTRRINLLAETTTTAMPRK